MRSTYIPAGYKSLLTVQETERAIKYVKDTFEHIFAESMGLLRISAPLFVSSDSGLNDNLNGVERPVTFGIREIENKDMEIVHSLAKWKRLSLAEHSVQPGHGIYTDMNAIRADEDLDALHSLYVDQWDWEAVITPAQRTTAFLHDVVRRIYAAIRRTEYLTCEHYPQILPFLPDDIFFITSQELLDMYPGMTPKQREDAITFEHKAVFIIGMILPTLSKSSRTFPSSPAKLDLGISNL